MHSSSGRGHQMVPNPQTGFLHIIPSGVQQNNVQAPLPPIEGLLEEPVSEDSMGVSEDITQEGEVFLPIQNPTFVPLESVDDPTRRHQPGEVWSFYDIYYLDPNTFLNRLVDLSTNLTEDCLDLMNDDTPGVEEIQALIRPHFREIFNLRNLFLKIREGHARRQGLRYPDHCNILIPAPFPMAAASLTTEPPSDSEEPSEGGSSGLLMSTSSGSDHSGGGSDFDEGGSSGAIMAPSSFEGISPFSCYFECLFTFFEIIQNFFICISFLGCLKNLLFFYSLIRMSAKFYHFFGKFSKKI